MPSTRSLPTVIGPTENALRALLINTLSTTPIGSYPAWVALNAASRVSPSAQRRAWIGDVADALKTDREAVDEVIDELRIRGLLAEDDALTEVGDSELGAARAAVAAATARLTEGISEDDQETARVVLDRIRDKAEELLRAAQRGPGAASRDGSLE